MGGTFIITLREAFEAALLLGIVYTYLDKVGGRRYYRYVTLGGALGLLASISAGVGVSFLSGPLLDLGPDLVAAVVIFAAVALLTWHGWWMRQHARALKGELQQRVEEAQSAGRLWALGRRRSRWAPRSPTRWRPASSSSATYSGGPAGRRRRRQSTGASREHDPTRRARPDPSAAGAGLPGREERGPLSGGA